MGLKLLVVEDDEGVREMLKLVLNYDGHDVIMAKDGTILDSLAEINPDIIFLDEWLCNERGSDLCRKLKANASTAGIPVILLSALMSVQQFSVQAGADGFIRKPFDLEELTAVINRYA
ncbi:Response regulator receiver domain-containing protein [Pedobacter westerhofensis]|uniref:Response regulator receiver domain-containing protein n=1 Tax=Pedobacter westerhofensis TaxID=425512 RepID=A0A521FG64_9SPHI|nr:response regulator [Pedobacter westerhofensis]SMO95188.1 Response regulator receiver domain-containing protein [Pedobacter westerhofensis]